MFYSEYRGSQSIQNQETFSRYTSLVPGTQAPFDEALFIKGYLLVISPLETVL